MERSLKWIRRALAALFAGLTLWMAYWSVIAAPRLAAHPGNPRLFQVEARIERGGIFARGGEALSVTQRAATGELRSYAGSRSLAHVVGYSDPRFGKAGLEAAFNAYLTGAASRAAGWARWLSVALGRPWSGWDVVTTIDAPLQEAAAQAMAGRKGALVAMDPRDGAILAMVSEPAFDPGHLDAYLDRATQTAGAPFFNRATQGEYPPGSVFKPVVMAAALESGTVSATSLFWDVGSIRIGDRTIRNAGDAAYGVLALDDALALSSNAVFASIAASLSPGSLREFASRLGIGERPPVEIPASKGRLPSLAELADAVVRAEVGIGQGTLLVTPLQMAVVASAVANGGFRVEPTLLYGLRPPGGKERLAARPAPVRAMTSGTASVIKEAMVEAARRGTARGASRPLAKPVAGKTGTAENPHGEPHAWFIGFYPADDPRIAVAVIIENGGYGSATAVPIARSLFMAWEETSGSVGR